MNVAIVDIDGTLTQTNDIDGECYVRAVSRFIGHPFPSDWSEFENVTDPGILDALCRKHLERAPTGYEIKSVQDELILELQYACSSRRDRFRAVPGAREFLARCVSAGWRLALATGAWARSARLKLEAAELPVDLPLASGDDSNERTGIVQCALNRIGAAESRGNRVVLIGDALWDLETAKRLEVAFVGVASGKDAQRLRSAGATHVIPDFVDIAAVFAALSDAGVPV